MEYFDGKPPAMQPIISAETRKRVENSLPLLDFLTNYWPYNPETGDRVPSQVMPITSEVAVNYLPHFQALQNQLVEPSKAKEDRLRTDYGLKLDDVSSIVALLDALVAPRI